MSSFATPEVIGGWTRRRHLRSLAAAASAGVLLACGPLQRRQSPEPASGPPVELLFWGPTPGTDQGITMEKLLTDLRQQQPRLVVRLEAVAAFGVDVTKAIAAIVAGSGPDLFYLGRWLTAQFAAHKAIASLEQWSKRSGRTLPLSDFYPRFIQESRWRGELYGLPYVAQPRDLFYNRAHFQEVGLSTDRPPTSWDELDQAAARLLKRGGDGQLARVGYVPIWGGQPGYLLWLVYLWQLGSDLLTPDNRRIAPDLPQRGAAALEKMADQLRRAGGLAAVQPVGAGLPPRTDQFSAGRVSMTYTANSVLPSYDKVAGLDYAVAPFPLPPNGRRVSYVAGPSLALGFGTKHAESAWQVIEYLLSPDPLRRFHIESGFVPPRKSVATSKEYLSVHRHYKAFVDMLPYGRWVPIVAGIQDILFALDEALTPAIHGQVSPRDGIENLIPKVQTILNQNAAFL